MPIGKILMLLGLALLITGALLTFVSKLPGDISYKKGNFSFHLPIMTSIIASIILTLIFCRSVTGSKTPTSSIRK